MLPRRALLVLCVAATLSYCRGGRRTGSVPDYGDDVGRVPDYDEEEDDLPNGKKKDLARFPKYDDDEDDATEDLEPYNDGPEPDEPGSLPEDYVTDDDEPGSMTDEYVEPDVVEFSNRKPSLHSFIQTGSMLSPEDRFRITRECLDKPVSESPWVTQVEGFCGEITCEISETVQSKAAKFNVKICPKKEDAICPHVAQVVEKFPECCEFMCGSWRPGYPEQLPGGADPEGHRMRSFDFGKVRDYVKDNVFNPIGEHVKEFLAYYIVMPVANKMIGFYLGPEYMRPYYGKNKTKPAD